MQPICGHHPDTGTGMRGIPWSVKFSRLERHFEQINNAGHPLGREV